MLWTPRYILEKGTTIPKRITNPHATFNFSNPMYFEIIGSKRGKATYEWPLGFPKSVGQNHYHLEISEETQIGRDCWYACLNMAIMWKPSKKKLKCMIALSLCFAIPISSKNIRAMIGVLHIREKMFIITANAFESAPSWITWMMLTPS